MKKSTLRLGCGAGFSGDRFEPAEILVERGNLDVLVLECLAERTIALAQKRKLQNPADGYDPYLVRRLERLLPLLHRHQVQLVTNMGAANPLAAGEKTLELARKANLPLRIAVVSGDDVISNLDLNTLCLETGTPLQALGEIVSANAYLGIEALLPAMASDADVIITGRVADPSLFLAPMIHYFQWDQSDYAKLGQGTVIGHLLECAGHLTGGYFADPLKKPVADMAFLGHPLAEIHADGQAILTKPPHTGGLLNVQTAKEQLLYEVINPHAYLTPDVTADFTQVELIQSGENRVLLRGGRGKMRPETLKVSVGYKAGYMGEGEIAYAGPGALARAQWAGEIVKLRLQKFIPELNIDLLGYNAIHRRQFMPTSEPTEVRLRVAGMAPDAFTAQLVGEDVEALYTNGPAGGGGARKLVTEVIGIASILMPREAVKPQLHILES